MTTALVPIKGRVRLPTRMADGSSEEFRPTRIGKIHLGEKRKTAAGKEYPAALDYFRFDDDALRQYPQIRDLYGDKPTELDVVVTSDSIEDVFQQRMEMYGKTRGLKCAGDGKVGYRFMCERCQSLACQCGDGKGNDRLAKFEVPCPCEWAEKRVCSRKGKLFVILWKVSWQGVWEVHTGSRNSILDIQSGLRQCRDMCRGLIMVPMTLRLAPRVCFPKGMQTTKYTMQLMLAATASEMIAIHMGRGIAAAMEKRFVGISTPDQEANALKVLDGTASPKAIAPGLPPMSAVPPCAEDVADANEPPPDVEDEDSDEAASAAHEEPPLDVDEPGDEPPKPATEPPRGKPEHDDNACRGCGTILESANVVTFSKKHWGMPLCYGCQKRPEYASKRKP